MRRLAPAVVLAAIASGFASSQAAGQTFANSSAINIPSSGPADLYPSVITTPPATPAAGSISVTLNSVSHGSPIEIGAVLVSPNGTPYLFMFCVGGNGVVTNQTLTFADAAADQVPFADPLASGSWKPTTRDCGPAPEDFPPPGPGTAFTYAGPFPSSSGMDATLASGPAAGNWLLYVADFNGGNTGSIAGGWTLSLTPRAAPTPGGVVGVPEASFLSVPPARTRSRTARFEFGANQNGSTFECSLDGRPFSGCTSPATYRVGAGVHRVMVRAMNAAGVRSEEAAWTWRVLKPKKKKPKRR